MSTFVFVLIIILLKPRKGAKLYPLDAMKAAQAYATGWVKNIKINIVKANGLFISILVQQ